jgi:ssDNA-binding Zn-finger/Zn-ribbon topoisomerase 1
MKQCPKCYKTYDDSLAVCLKDSAELRDVQVEAISHLAAESQETAQCPFCKEIIIKGAIKCKHCGEILNEALKPHKRKSFYAIFGFMSLAATILCSFIPAITTPIFLFFSIVFALLEFGFGNKLFASIVLIFAIINAGMIGNHFASVSKDIQKSQEEMNKAIQKSQNELDQSLYGYDNRPGANQR